MKSYYEYHMWGLQKYQNHYEILFERGYIDLKNSAVLLLLAQGKSDTHSLFEDFNMARHFKNIFLILVNVNRLCWHVGLKFWTINSFICPKSTNLTTWQFRFTTLYSGLTDVSQILDSFGSLLRHNLFHKFFISYVLTKSKWHWHHWHSLRSWNRTLR